jgi:hypothetical protein
MVTTAHVHYPVNELMKPPVTNHEDRHAGGSAG